MKERCAMLHKVMIAGGGTGGHIFPAIAIAKALKQINPELELLFVGAEGRMEMEKVPAAGFQIVGLPIQGVPRRKTPIALFRFLLHWYRSNRKAEKVLRAFAPDVIVGVGGYASVPAMQAAQKYKIPTFIQEQNSYAGKANRMLARKVQRIAVAYPNMERYFPTEKIVFTGNPVREELLRALPPRDEACAAIGIPAKTRNILVVGGSLGARKLTEAILDHAQEIALHPELTILLQTGAGDFEAMRARVAEAGVKNIVPTAFITRMECAYAAADLIVSRAGAIAISELCIVAKPVILVPSPYVAEDHQTKNARVLEERGAALLIREADASTRLWREIENLLTDDRRKEAMHLALRELARPKASAEIASQIVALGDK